MKEKGDPCILIGYSTQSKGYRVYNKRTRLIVESIHIRFDEIKEVSETSVANDTLGLVPRRQKASEFDNPDPVSLDKMFLLQQMYMFHHNKSWIFYLVHCTMNFSMHVVEDDGKMHQNVEHAGCIDSHKSTSGGIQFLCDKLVSWMSKKQNCIAMSSAEDEYVALSASCAQVIWMRTQLQDYGFNYSKIPLYC
nr:uncharacterized mitochondrial protein AtMg00810-like [Tanacetum cinerariifolium]